MPDFGLVVECSNGHRQTARVIRPVLVDGTLTSGLLGSSADLCDECESPIEREIEVVPLDDSVV